MADPRRSHPYKHLADIFSKLKSSKQNQFLTELEKQDGEAAEQIRSLMFTFEDLIRIEPQEIQLLLLHVDPNQLATALKGASAQITKMFFENMSKRAGQMLQDDMDAVGPVRMAEVEAAQEHIASTAKSLADTGKIILKNGEDDEYI